MAEISRDTDDYLTEEEVVFALEGMTHADLHRLSKVAGRLAGRGFSGDDLLQEAIRRMLGNVRIWKRGMRPVPFLYSAMKSIASAGFKKKNPENAALYSLDHVFETAPTSAAGNEQACSAEDYMIRAEEEAEEEKKSKALLKEVLDLFKDDEQATWVLMGQMDGCTVAEVCSMSGMTSTQYDTTRRRIRRALDKSFPNGWSVQ